MRRLLDAGTLKRLPAQHAETSVQEFFDAIELIFDELPLPSDVIATDYLRFSGDPYWTSSLGLRYLEANFKATLRGVTIKRIFLVNAADWLRRKTKIIETARLHRKAGVDTSYVVVESLDEDCRTELAMFGAELVDLPVHNAEGRIVRNLISWNPTHRAEVRQKLDKVIRLSEPLELKYPRAPDFSRIRKYARDTAKTRPKTRP
jgi:hypothetical protein